MCLEKHKPGKGKYQVRQVEKKHLLCEEQEYGRRFLQEKNLKNPKK